MLSILILLTCGLLTSGQVTAYSSKDTPYPYASERSYTNFSVENSQPSQQTDGGLFKRKKKKKDCDCPGNKKNRRKVARERRSRNTA
jgi:hypothetical protein